MPKPEVPKSSRTRGRPSSYEKALEAYISESIEFEKRVGELAPNLVKFAVQSHAGHGHVARTDRTLPEEFKDEFDALAERIVAACDLLRAIGIPLNYTWDPDAGKLRIPAREFSRNQLDRSDLLNVGEMLCRAEYEFQYRRNTIVHRLIPNHGSWRYFFGHGLTTYGIAHAMLARLKDYRNCTFGTNSFEIAALGYLGDYSEWRNFAIDLNGREINLDHGLARSERPRGFNTVSIVSFAGMTRNASLFTRTEPFRLDVCQDAAEQLNDEIQNCRHAVYVGTKEKIEKGMRGSGPDQAPLIDWAPHVDPDADPDKYADHLPRFVFLVTDEVPDQMYVDALQKAQPHVIPVTLQEDEDGRVTAEKWPGYTVAWEDPPTSTP